MCVYTEDNLLAKARGLSSHTYAKFNNLHLSCDIPMFYLTMYKVHVNDSAIRKLMYGCAYDIRKYNPQALGKARGLSSRTYTQTIQDLTLILHMFINFLLGDVILSVNGDRVGEVTHRQLVHKIRRAGDTLR